MRGMHVSAAINCESMVEVPLNNFCKNQLIINQQKYYYFGD